MESLKAKAFAALIAVFIIIPLLGQMSSAGFLWYFGGDPNDATLTSYPYLLMDYWHIPKYRVTLLLGLFLPLILIVLLVGIVLISKHLTKPLYGTRHFADAAEIQAAGLFNEHGVMLGKHKGRYLIADGQFSALVVGPPRSGKGAGIAIPTLLGGWKDSVIALDIRDELSSATADFRAQHGQTVHRFSPLDENSARWNPLDYVPHDGPDRIDRLQLVAHTLIPDPRNNTTSIWTSGARSLLSALVLYLMDTGGRVTLGQSNRLMLDSMDLGEFFKMELSDDGPLLSDPCRREMMAFCNKAEKERSGVLSTLRTALELWNNPKVDRATSSTDFNIGDMRRERVTVYISIGPADINRLSTLIGLLIEQSIGYLLRQVPRDDEPYQVLLLLDELHAFGRLNSIMDGIAYMAGFNIVPLVMVQDFRQLQDVYGDNIADVFLSSSKYKVFLSVNDPKTAEYVSKSLGDRTELVKHVSKPSFSRNPFAGMVSKHQVARPLLTASEIMDLSKKKQIVLVESNPPIMADKIQYFEDSILSSRATKEST